MGKILFFYWDEGGKNYFWYLNFFIDGYGIKDFLYLGFWGLCVKIFFFFIIYGVYLKMCFIYIINYI